MSIPQFVPLQPDTTPRNGVQPRHYSWVADRPGELTEGGHPPGCGLGAPGPDQGYAFVLARHLRPQLHLTPQESWNDVEAGCVPIALKRSSRFTRAPVIHDLRVAFTIWGYFDARPDPELVKLREKAFSEIHHAERYGDTRILVDSVQDNVLMQSRAQVEAHYADSWRNGIQADRIKVLIVGTEPQEPAQVFTCVTPATGPRPPDRAAFPADRMSGGPAKG